MACVYKRTHWTDHGDFVCFHLKSLSIVLRASEQ
jgi:hypothetical protein